MAGSVALAGAGIALVRSAVREAQPLLVDAGHSAPDAVPEPLPVDAALLRDNPGDATAHAEAGTEPREVADAAVRSARDAGTWRWPALTTATAPTTSTPAINCNPPYFYDAHGNKVFKLGCLP
jgi:hypothetical protein